MEIRELLDTTVTVLLVEGREEVALDRTLVFTMGVFTGEQDPKFDWQPLPHLQTLAVIF